MTIRKNLLALNKDIEALGKKVEKLLKSIEKSDKVRTAKAPAKKAVTAKIKQKAAAKSVPEKKKSGDASATAQVLKIISRSKKGVDTATLMKKTGFNQKKVWNIIHRVSKAGKIKRLDKGIYAAMK